MTERAKSPIICGHCGQSTMRRNGDITRANTQGKPLYCDKDCAGLARRRKVEITPEQAKEAKRIYDAQYRAKNAAVLKVKKAAIYQRTADREKEREYRKANMHKHVAYCQRPEYRLRKSTYDRKYLANKKFGEFADAALILRDLESEISTRATRYEIYSTNGLLNKAQQRRRAL